MNLTMKSLRQLDNPMLTLSERAAVRCACAKELEEAGNYESARKVLGDLWGRLGERPTLDGLDESTKALVLLRVGALTGWIGSATQFDGAQEVAKDLISESGTIYESLGEKSKALEAQVEMSLCYWREGSFDEARALLQDAVARLADEELKAVAAIRLAIVERRMNRLSSALSCLNDVQAIVISSESHSLKGKFHVELAITLEFLGKIERGEDFTDRSLLEYAAASFHFEQAGNLRYCARVENNLGFLFYRIVRFDEAREHLERARRLFVSLKEHGSVAQVDETRARALLAQGRSAEAERIVRSAVNTLYKGDEFALLAEALTTHGVALARLNRLAQARDSLLKAIDVAERAGDLHGAGRAACTAVEELEKFSPVEQLRDFYNLADRLLTDSEDVETLSRLRTCARRIVAGDVQAKAAISTHTKFVHAAESSSEIVSYAHRVASTGKPVLICGETGAGKEVLARLLHEWSGRGGRFVAVNCAALSDTVFESQLFGHRRGSFTDAIDDHEGAVRMATGGTLLLDEIGELSLTNQGKLLRLIENNEIFTVGSSLPELVDVRIVAATNHDLRQDVARGNFREDLFYRLGAFIIELPPLRERTEDIPALALHFIEDASARHGGKSVVFTPDGVETMKSLPLKGNARELRAMIERTFLQAPDGAEITAGAVETLALRHQPQAGFSNVWEGCALDEEVRKFEGQLISRALEATGGHLTGAARLLGVTHQGLAFILNGRHKELLPARKPAQPRRRSILGLATPRAGKSLKKAPRG